MTNIMKGDGSKGTEGSILRDSSLTLVWKCVREWRRSQGKVDTGK